MIYLYIILLIGIITAAYSVLEAKIIKIKKIFINDAPKSMSGKKIAVFSDVHIGFYVTKGQLIRCMDKINRQNPDYIFFAGDFAEKFKKDYSSIFPDVCEILKAMKAKAGKFAVFGNNDCHNSKAHEFSENALKSGGFTILENDGVPLENDVFLAGVCDGRYNPADIKQALNYCPKSAYKIALVHAPDLAVEYSDYNINMQISGHSHGGQVFIPFLYKIMLPQEAKIYSRGNHKVKNTMLYISNGVGVHTLPFRFLTPPDILIFYFK